VIGARPIQSIKHFSPFKKFLQNFGSFVVRLASQTKIPDAPSGFRAINREAALRLNVFNEYTYTLETIIQAGQKGLIITSVPIRTNGFERPSRLVKNIFTYVQRSILTIVRPLRFFILLGSVPFGLGFLLCCRWLWLFWGIIGDDPAKPRVPSLILAAILILIGVQLWIFGLIADLMGVNRQLLEDIQLRLRRQEYQKKSNSKSTKG
jgi:hypothetical protein